MAAVTVATAAVATMVAAAAVMAALAAATVAGVTVAVATLMVLAVMMEPDGEAAGLARAVAAVAAVAVLVVAALAVVLLAVLVVVLPVLAMEWVWLALERVSMVVETKAEAREAATKVALVQVGKATARAEVSPAQGWMAQASSAVDTVKRAAWKVVAVEVKADVASSNTVMERTAMAAVVATGVWRELWLTAKRSAQNNARASLGHYHPLATR